MWRVAVTGLMALAMSCTRPAEQHVEVLSLFVHPDLAELAIESELGEFEQKLGLEIEVSYVELEKSGANARCDVYLTPSCVEQPIAEFMLVRETIVVAGQPAGPVMIADTATPWGRLCMRAMAQGGLSLKDVETYDPRLGAGVLAIEHRALWVPASWVGRDEEADRLDPWPTLPMCVKGQVLARGAEAMNARRLAHHLQTKLQFGKFGYIPRPAEAAQAGADLRHSYWAIGSEL